MRSLRWILAAILLFIAAFAASAYDVAEKNWGIAAGFRNAKIPYPTNEERVNDFIPLLFYDGDTFFVRGLTAGARLYDKDAWQFSLIGDYRYFDIPSGYQNLAQGNAFDLGGEAKYRLNKDFEVNLQIMSDNDGRYYSALDARYHWEDDSWELLPYASLRLKGADFNNYYFGLDGFVDPRNVNDKIENNIGSGSDLTLGSEVRYHVVSNFYLLGRAQLTALDSTTRDSITIDNGTYGEVYLGIAFFNDKAKTKKSALEIKPYLRIAHGWATPSNIGTILSLDWEDDEQNNQLSSLFYGHPLADSLFGIEALDIYMTLGYVYHHGSNSYSQTLDPGNGINTTELASLGSNPCDGSNPCTITYDSQPTSEYVIGIKAYYNFQWPLHWRLGFAEGISYIETVANIEQREMDRKGYRSSQLMNYLDFTADFSLGKTFNNASIRDLYLGVGVHHRSSIFESSSAFGRIKGGSNYNSVYLQYHF
jgi:outer membrane protein